MKTILKIKTRGVVILEVILTGNMIRFVAKNIIFCPRPTVNITDFSQG